MSLSDMHRFRVVSTFMVSVAVGCNRMTSLNRAMYGLGGGEGDVASWLRDGEYICNSVSGAFSECEGLIVGCWGIVARHSANNRYWVMSWWYDVVARANVPLIS